MAKLSFEEAELNSLDISDLSAFEKDVLEDWYNKFKLFRCYPVVGRVSMPPTGLRLTKDQLKEFRGEQPVPAGRVDAPIYISLRRKILDVSYGGKEMYGPGGGYHLFSGVDCAKALAKMSFESTLQGDLNFSDLTPEEMTVLEDWEKKLGAKYPQVGELVDE